MTHPAGGAIEPSTSSSTSPTSPVSPLFSNLPEENSQNNLVHPKSGINFVLYNSGLEVVEENTGYLPVDDRINAIQNLATDRMVMTEAGFIEIFVNNDAVTPVYYDNMTVTMRGGNVAEVYAYYPNGLMIPDLSTFLNSIGGIPPFNLYRFANKEWQSETHWIDMENRMQDPVVGRWWTPDPMAENRPWESTYSYCGNNPINRIDPDGMTWLTTLDDEIAKQIQQAAQEQLKQTNKEILRLEKRIGKLEGKRDVSDLKENLYKARYEASLLDNLNKGIEGIRLDETTKYTFQTIEGNSGFLSSKEDGTIVLKNTGDFENRVHETVHAVQYFNKEITLVKPGGDNFYPSGLGMELPAYRTQFILERPITTPTGATVPKGHTLPGQPKNIMEINNQWYNKYIRR